MGRLLKFGKENRGSSYRLSIGIWQEPERSTNEEIAHATFIARPNAGICRMDSEASRYKFEYELHES
jgi:hypothetical protein